MNHHVTSLLPWVPRSAHEKAVRLLEAARERIDDLVGERETLVQTIHAYQRTEADLEAHVATNEALIASQAQTLTNVRVALRQVAVFEGMTEHSPLVLMVDQLARDHEELEGRIDAIAHLVMAERDASPLSRRGYEDLYTEIGRLIQGGSRVPDTLEGLDD